MKLRSIIVLIFWSLVLQVPAQDTLVDVYGKMYFGKEQNRNDRILIFKTAEKLLTFKMGNIGYIATSDGEERINWNRYRAYTDTHKEWEGYKKNCIALNIADFAFVNLTLSYERIFNSGKNSIKIPLSVGLGGKPTQKFYTGAFEDLTFMKNKNYSAGLEFNYYPIGQTRHTYYLGLSIVAGSFNYYPPVLDTLNTYYYNGGVNYYIDYTAGPKHYGQHYAGMIHLGGILGISRELALGMKLGMGFRREETIIEDYTHFKLQGDLTLAYRF